MREVIRLRSPFDVSVVVERDSAGVNIWFDRGQNAVAIGLTTESAEKIGRALVLAAAGDTQALVRQRDELIHERETLLRFLLDADLVATRRGDKYGICDCIDKSGEPYQSAALDHWLTIARRLPPER